MKDNKLIISRHSIQLAMQFKKHVHALINSCAWICAIYCSIVVVVFLLCLLTRTNTAVFKECSSCQCKWGPAVKGVFISGYAGGVKTQYSTLAKAQFVCEGLGSKCGGVTYAPSKGSFSQGSGFSVREANAYAKAGNPGRISWLRLTCDTTTTTTTTAGSFALRWM